MAVVLGDQADGGPVVTVIVRVVGEELIGAAQVEVVHLDGAAQGVAQQKHLYLRGDQGGHTWSNPSSLEIDLHSKISNQPFI